MVRSIWSILAWIVGIGIVCCVGLAALVGPTVYREGRAVFEPIRNLSSIEDRLFELNTSLPFEAPSEITIDEARLQAFLSIRGALKDQYATWQAAVEEAEDHHGDSWSGAKKVITLTSEVFDAQIESFERFQMSPDEFLWLERVVYRKWLREVDRLPSGAAAATVTHRLRVATEEDLALVTSLQRLHGDSAALSDLENHFRLRQATLDQPEPSPVEGIAEAVHSLLWRHHEQIAELDLSRYSDIHSGVLQAGRHNDGSAFRVNIGMPD